MMHILHIRKFIEKKTFLLSILLLIPFFLLTSCKKDKDSDKLSGGLEAISWPQRWVMVYDRDETNYSYIYSAGGIALYRGGVEKTYSINNLIAEKDCYFEVISAGYGGGEKLFLIRSVQEPDHWWGTFRTNSPFGAEEWYLGQDEDDNTPEGDEYRFILHPMADEGGKKTFVIESYFKRGQYLDNVGHTFTGNGLSFVAHDKPEKAPHYKMLSATGSGIGG